MTLVPMAGANRESQCLEYGHHSPSLLVHLWTLVDPVAGVKGKSYQHGDKALQAWQHVAILTPP